MARGLVCILGCLTIVTLSESGAAYAAACPGEVGDVGGDGELSIADVQCMLVFAAAALAGGGPPACLDEEWLNGLSPAFQPTIANVQELIALLLAEPIAKGGVDAVILSPSETSFGFGSAMAVDAESGWAVIGDSGDTAGGSLAYAAPGAAHFYREDDGEWVHWQSVVSGPDEYWPHPTSDLGAGVANRGVAVDIDGEWAVVGASRTIWSDAGWETGGARVYRRGEGDVWEPVGEWLRIPTSWAAPYMGGGAPGYFGAAVAVDYPTIVVASPHHGWVMVYQAEGDDWGVPTQLGLSEWPHGGPSSMGGHGAALALEGEVIAVGAESGAGSIFVYERQAAGDWPLRAKLLPGGTGHLLGTDVAVSDGFVYGAAGLSRGLHAQALGDLPAAGGTPSTVWASPIYQPAEGALWGIDVGLATAVTGDRIVATDQLSSIARLERSPDGAWDLVEELRGCSSLSEIHQVTAIAADGPWIFAGISESEPTENSTPLYPQGAVLTYLR